jgi:hypothetical protein
MSDLMVRIIKYVPQPVDCAKLLSEYADLDPATAALLVINAKQTQAQPLQPPAPAQAPATAPGYGNYTLPLTPQSNYAPAQPPAAPLPSTNAGNPDLSSLISSMDASQLQKLLGAIQPPQSQQAPQQQASPSFSGAAGATDLARLLGSMSAQQGQTQGYQPPSGQTPQQYQDSFQSLANNPAFASLLGNQSTPAAAPVQPPTQATPSPQQPDMAEIMAQLAKYQR